MKYIFVFFIGLAIYANGAPVLEDYKKITEYVVPNNDNSQESSLEDNEDLKQYYLQDNTNKEYDATDEKLIELIAKYVADVRKVAKSHSKTAEIKTKEISKKAVEYISQSESFVVQYVSRRLNDHISTLFIYENEENEDCIWNAVRAANIVSVEHLNAAKNFAREQSNLFKDLLLEAVNDMTKTFDKIEEINSDLGKCEDRQCLANQLLLIKEVEKYVKDEGFEASVDLVFIGPAYLENLQYFQNNHRTSFNNNCDRLLEYAKDQCKLPM